MITLLFSLRRMRNQSWRRWAQPLHVRTCRVNDWEYRKMLKRRAYLFKYVCALKWFLHPEFTNNTYFMPQSVFYSLWESLKSKTTTFYGSELKQQATPAYCYSLILKHMHSAKRWRKQIWRYLNYHCLFSGMIWLMKIYHHYSITTLSKIWVRKRSGSRASVSCSQVGLSL